MMKFLVTLLLLGCVSSSPLADPDDYQYDDPENDQENLENEEIASDFNIEIISQPETFRPKIGQKVVLPCRVQPEGLDSALVNRYWDRPDTETKQALAIGDNIYGNDGFGVEGSNLIIFSVAEKHVGEFRCRVRDGQVTHTVKLSQDDFPHASEKIVYNNSSILGHSLYLTLILLSVYLLHL